MPKILLFVLLFVLAMILSALNVGSFEAVRADDARVSLRLEAASLDEGYICVAVIYDGSEELCGALAEIEYDPEALCFERISRGGDLSGGACLTYACGDGRISVLLDSVEAVGCGEMAVICFSIIRDSGEVGYISLRGGFGNACVLRDERVVKAHLSDDTLICNMSSSLEDGTLSAELSVDGSGLRLRGITLRDCCFMGFDVTVTDIYSGNVQSFTVSSKTETNDSGAYFATAILPVACDGRSVIVIKSLCYGKESTAEGEEKIFFVCGGKIQRVGDSE